MPIDLQTALTSVTHVADGLALAQRRASNTEWSLFCGCTYADGMENGEATDFVIKLLMRNRATISLI